MPRRGQVLEKTAQMRRRIRELLADGVERGTREITEALMPKGKSTHMVWHLLAMHAEGQLQRRGDRSRWYWRIDGAKEG